MDNKIKEALKIIGTLMAIGGILAMIFSPGIFSGKFSLIGIEEKKIFMETLEGEMERGESLIMQNISDRARLMESNIENRKRANEMRELLDEQFLQLDIPSLILTLEQTSNDLGIENSKFFISYDQIAVGGHRNSDRIDEGMGEDMESRNEVLENATSSEELVEEIMVEESDVPTDHNLSSFEYAGEMSEGSFEGALQYIQPKNLRSVAVTTIPIMFKEISYAQAMEYMSFIDNLDFIEPAVLDLYSHGESVTMVMILSVYHQVEEGGLRYEK